MSNRLKWSRTEEVLDFLKKVIDMLLHVMLSLFQNKNIENQIRKGKEQMSKKELQKYIREREGLILSEGTLRHEDLLATAYDFLTAWGIRFNKAKILGLFETDGEVHSLQEKVYWDLAKIKDDTEEVWEVWQNVSDFLNEIAPNGYYFGSHPGDGACIGFFRDEVED